MSIQKVVLANANRVKVTKVKSLTPLNFFQAGEKKKSFTINRVYDTKLKGDSISVGRSLETDQIDTSTILEIAFCNVYTLQIRTRSSVYSVEILN
jgi:hypothetical protein